MSHTPGPWDIGIRLAAYRDTGEVFPAFDAISVGTPRGQVAIIPLDESSEANARLIATAPDLLDALQDMYDNFSPPEMVDPRSRSDVDKAAAHAKAQALILRLNSSIQAEGR